MTDLDAADGVTIVRFDNAPVNALDLDLLELIIASMHSVAAGRHHRRRSGLLGGVDLRALADGARRALRRRACC